MIVHLKMYVLSLFTDPNVVPNLYQFPSFVEHKILQYILKNVGNR